MDYRTITREQLIDELIDIKGELEIYENRLSNAESEATYWENKYDEMETKYDDAEEEFETNCDAVAELDCINEIFGSNNLYISTLSLYERMKLETLFEIYHKSSLDELNEINKNK